MTTTTDTPVAQLAPIVNDEALPVRATVDAAALKAALLKLKPALSRTGHNSISGMVKVATTPQGMTLTATDLDLTIDVAVPATSLRHAETVLPFAALKKAADVFAKGPMEVEVLSQGHGELRSGNQTLEVEPLPAKEWPKPLSFAGGRLVVLDTTVLAELLPAVAKEGSRPILNAVCVDGGAYAATDSYRLAAVRTTAATGDQFLIPRDAAVVLAKYPGRLTAVVRDGERGSQGALTATAGDVTVTTGLVEGEFPAWQKLLPAGRTGGLEITDAFLDDLKKVMKLGPSSANLPVRIQPAEDGTGLVLSISEDGKGAKVATPGSSTVELLSFNPPYLIDTLTGTTSRTLHVIDQLKPLFLEEDALEYGPACTRIRLIMPVRVS